MKRILIGAVVAVLVGWAAPAIAEDRMAATYGNTVVVTDPDGNEVSRYFFNEDGTVTAFRPDGKFEGTWTIDEDGKLCSTINEQTYCTMVPENEVGDSWETETESGLPVKVSIITGRIEPS